MLRSLLLGFSLGLRGLGFRVWGLWGLGFMVEEFRVEEFWVMGSSIMSGSFGSEFGVVLSP